MKRMRTIKKNKKYNSKNLSRKKTGGGGEWEVEVLNKLSALERKIDDNGNLDDLYKILRANNIVAYGLNDPRRADMDARMQNDYKRFRWRRSVYVENICWDK